MSDDILSFEGVDPLNDNIVNRVDLYDRYNGGPGSCAEIIRRLR